jgi:uncharacterized membrane protein HdeD (DUF308 family)
MPRSPKVPSRGGRPPGVLRPVRSMPLPATTLTAIDLAGKLWRASLLRGLVALALGAYVLSRPIDSPAGLVRIVCVYWICDGLVALWASRFAATVKHNQTLLVVRGVVGIVTAMFLAGLPLGEIFGPWRPGQIMLFILTMGPAVIAIGLQIVMAATIDLFIGFEVRRRIPGEWSVALGAVISIVLGGLASTGFLAISAVTGRLLGVACVSGGLGLVAGSIWLRATR